MADTYSQIIIQLVSAVEGRQSLIGPAHQEDKQYITGIVKKYGQQNACGWVSCWTQSALGLGLPSLQTCCPAGDRGMVG